MALYGKKLSRYGFPACHNIILFLLLFFISSFFKAALLLEQLAFSSTSSPHQNQSHRSTCTFLKHRQKVVQNYWKITKMWFRFLVSEELPHTARALGTPHRSCSRAPVGVLCSFYPAIFFCPPKVHLGLCFFPTHQYFGPAFHEPFRVGSEWVTHPSPSKGSTLKHPSFQRA